MLMRKRPRTSMKCGASQSRWRSTASGAASGSTQVGRVGPYHSTTFSTRIRPISTGFTATSSRRPDDRSGQRAEKVEQHAVEGLGLVEVRGMAGVLDDLEARAGDLLGHVLARGDERGVAVAQNDERGHANRGQRVDDGGALLG